MHDSPSQGRYRPSLLILCILLIPASFAGHAAENNQVERLREELEALKERVNHLENQLEAAQSRKSAPAPVSGQGSGADESTVDAPLVDIGIADAMTGAEMALADQTDDQEETEAPISVGGALRFNAFWTDFNESVETKRGDSGLDLFRINVDGEYDNILLSAEYRWYPFMQAIHHGWIGYDFDSGSQVQLGVSQVPFGILPYASHNYWFGVPYYLGLSDDYDLGGKYVHETGSWDLALGFYKNAELGDASSLSRYSFDVVRAGGQQNEETNQFNARLAYTLGRGTGCYHELGGSAQWGELFNAATGNRGDHWAAAAHLDSRCGRWNVQLQLARYGYSPENPPDFGDSIVRLGAFETSYDVAARGTLGVFNVAYNFPVPWESIDQITCYNDYSVLRKDSDGFRDSKLNTTGCAIGLGPVFTYIDLINARNMVFFGDGSLAGGGDDEWHTRINLNLGYYW